MAGTVCLAVATMLVEVPRARACGPFFPNTLLDGGERAVLQAPMASFHAELARMCGCDVRIWGGVSDSDTATFVQLELADLSEALAALGAPARERDLVLDGYAAARERLGDDLGASPWTDWRSWGGSSHAPPPITITVRASDLPPGTPAEFADYFAGAVAWYDPKKSGAETRAPWEELLRRAPAQRHYRSTWAALMLGRAWEPEAPDSAVRYYRMVRSLAQQGFADRLGLAADSRGLEARAHYRARRFAAAIHLYLQQLSVRDPLPEGGPWAVESLRYVAHDAVRAGADTLRALARDAECRRVITAYLIAHAPDGWAGFDDEEYGESVWRGSSAAEPSQREVEVRWLRAVEAAGVKEVESAERLALAAYQRGAMDLAGRWVQIADESPVARWLRAKLLLRDGRVDEAEALLASVTPSLPATRAKVEDDREEEETPVGPDWAADFYLGNDGFAPIGPRAQALGELGVLRLALGRYVEALDPLLRSGYWQDAAYVAERVLTLEELRQYVDREWPAPAPRPPLRVLNDWNDEWTDIALWDAWDKPQFTDPDILAVSIRYLLGRRLARAGRWAEALGYFPAEWQSSLDSLADGRRRADDGSLPDVDRARALFLAATITRNRGMELLGAEGAPDWRMYDGEYGDEDGWGVSVGTRARVADFGHVAATLDELQRARAHAPSPDRRLHYRYTAARLAGQAADLLPDQSPETAHVLYTAGMWLKDRDPKAAEPYYRALVRRCGKTALGAEAARRRWFPPAGVGREGH